MSHTFLAFIDESGDDGLGKYRQPGQRGGASQWLIISALVFRSIFEVDAVAWRDEINSLMPDKKKRDLHFKNLNHGQRLAATRYLSGKPVRVLSVLAHKPSMDVKIYSEKNQLYFYLTRYLVERLSWLSRDYRPRAPEGDGRIRITFSRRGGMSYPDFQDYLRKLKGDDNGDVRIHWPVVDIDSVSAADHSLSASLQLADVAASAFAYGVEPDQYGNCEARYAENLQKKAYGRGGNYLSYGVKIFPRLEDIPPSRDFGRFINLFK